VVKVRLERDPDAKRIEFESRVKGGAIPKEYIQAVGDGILAEADGTGVGWGYKIVQVRATLLDGSYHEVDSSDVAFRSAGARAFREGFEKAGSILLEPWMRFEIDVPDEHLGAVVNDLGGRRADIGEMDLRGGVRHLRGVIPLREILGYTTQLRSLSQGRGTAVFEPWQYLPTPEEITRQMV
jgi:elongation factor G